MLRMGMALQMDTRAVLLNELNIQFLPLFFYLVYVVTLEKNRGYPFGALSPSLPCLTATGNRTASSACMRRRQCER